MADPSRIRLSRSRGFDLQGHSFALNGLPARHCARPGVFGNPFSIRIFGKASAVALFRTWVEADNAAEFGYGGDYASLLDARRKKILDHIHELRGHNLACWCLPPDPGERDICHAAVLLEMANG